MEASSTGSTSAESVAPTHLKRALGLRDLVLFNVVAVLGLRWLATSAKTGPSAMGLWLLAAVFFFVPQGLAVVELSSRFPQEGGVYFWTKRALGEGHGFLCGWCYWICNVLYYPNLLISSAVIALYVVGKGGTSAESSIAYIVTATLVCLWLAVAMNIVGAGTGKWLQNLGGIGTYIPGVVLVVLGAWSAIAHHPSANALSARAMVPDLGNFNELNLWASIAFAFAGLELSATMGDEIENPRRNLPRAIYIAAPLIAFAYVLGTLGLLWLVPVGNINIVSGFLQAITAGAQQISPALMWIPPVAAAAYTIGNIGGVGAWLTGPARVAFVIGLDRYFPPAFGKVHPKWKTPYVAILVQAVLATVFLLISVVGKGSTVERAYLILLDTQLLVYFIPYLYLFLVFLMHRLRDVERENVMLAPGGTVGAWLIGGCGLAITLFAMIVAMVPPSDAASTLSFELKVVGGAGGFLLIGGLLYWRARLRKS
jgi:amino acid transporter